MYPDPCDVTRAQNSQTQQYVRLYNLAEQKLVKTFMPGIKWISSMDIHPSGDHLIVGGYDRKLCWFDLELSDKPYKVMRYVALAIGVLPHKRSPSIDITQGPYVHCISIRLTLYSRHPLMMAQYRSSTLECTTI